jgi:hypothetical protein
MLLVLMLLTSVLAPSIFDFINDAQWVKVKEDCVGIRLLVARAHPKLVASVVALGYEEPTEAEVGSVGNHDLGTPA